MKYKVDDKVKIKSWSGMKQNYGLSEYGSINISVHFFSLKMRLHCNTVVTIKKVHPNYYEIKEDTGKWCWTDEMIYHRATKILSIINRLEKLKKSVNDTFKTIINEDIKKLKSNKPVFNEITINYYNAIFHLANANRFKFRVEPSFSKDYLLYYLKVEKCPIQKKKC